MNGDGITRRQFLKIGGGLLAAGALHLHGSLLRRVTATSTGGVLDVTSLDKTLIENLLKTAMQRGGTFSELFAQQRVGIDWRLDNGQLTAAETSRADGVGIRVADSGSFGYAFCEELSEENLVRAAKKASAQMASGERGGLHPLERRSHSEHCPVSQPVLTAGSAELLDRIRTADTAARGVAANVRRVVVSLSEHSDYRMVANSQGSWIEDIAPRLFLEVQVEAGTDERAEIGRACAGTRMGYEFFDTFPPAALGERAARQALAFLAAEPMESGPLPVVTGNRCGYLFHVLIGRHREAEGGLHDEPATGGRILSPLITYLDDATTANGFGSYNMDDEGVPAQRTILVRLGHPDKLLLDQLGAKRRHTLSSGSGRRADYRHPPIPCLSNAVLAAGVSRHDTIMEEIERGLYIVEVAHTHVEEPGGTLLFPIREAYSIRQGKPGDAVKNVMLVTTRDSLLQSIERVGDDPAFVPGFTHKNGQTLPVSFGAPSVRFKQLSIAALR
ncbi:TldD/PmbA family protein [bacterium]|nr:TldD/PmbA family protein [candidate division CSSED10-310 bacterium]